MALAHALGLIAAVIGIILFAWLASGITIVHAHHKAVLERFGRYRRTIGPGLHLTLRFVHTLQRVDERECMLDVAADALTADDVAVGVDVATYYECIDARRFVYDVSNPELAVARLVETHVRNLVRELPLEELLNGAGRVTAALTAALDEATQAWGIHVTRVEIARIELSAELADSIAEKAAAERNRQARVAEEETTALVEAIRAEAVHQARLRDSEVEQTMLLMGIEREAAAVRVRADAEYYREQALARAEAETIRIISSALRQAWSGSEPANLHYLDASRPEEAECATPPLPPPEPQRIENGSVEVHQA